MPMTIPWLDWFGYLASVVILISLTMSSIVRLRWINLAGAVMFAAFGYLIGSIPTGTLNLGIALIDIYYLVRLYRAKDELAMVYFPTDDPLEGLVKLRHIEGNQFKRIRDDEELGEEIVFEVGRDGQVIRVHRHSNYWTKVR